MLILNFAYILIGTEFSNKHWVFKPWQVNVFITSKNQNDAKSKCEKICYNFGSIVLPVLVARYLLVVIILTQIL